MFEDDTRIPIFVGGFLWGLSGLVVIMGMFFLNQFSETVSGDHLEIALGWLGANVLGLIIAFRFYSGNSYSGSMGGDSEGDSAVSFVGGFSLALYALLATWLFLEETPELVITFGMTSAAMAFIGIVLVFYYWGSSSPY